jgi:hypothetical protein
MGSSVAGHHCRPSPRRRREGPEPPEGATSPSCGSSRDWAKGTTAQPFDSGALTLRWVRAPAKARGGATILSGHYGQPPPSIFALRRREKKRMRSRVLGSRPAMVLIAQEP